MRLALGLLITALSAAACGSGPGPEAAPASTRRLTLRAVDERPLAPTRILRVFEPADLNRPDGWRVDGDGVTTRVTKTVMRTVRTNVLELRGEGQIAVRIPIGPDEVGLNQVVLTLAARAPVIARLTLGGDDEDGPRTPGQRTDGGPGPVTLVFDLPGQGWPEDVSRTLTASFRSERGPVRLVSLALLHRPLERWLPSPREGARMVTIGASDGRRAVGLALDRPLEVSFDARAGEQLSFSHGVPSASRGWGRDHAVLVTLQGEQGAERRWSFATAYEWRTETLALDAWSGPTTARFELELEGGTQGLVALGEPALERTRSGAPTVLLITSDTHRADHVGAVGGALGGELRVRTPALDRLAARGVLFEDCVSPANVTLPSHAALMTGTSPRDTGVVNNADFLGDDPLTLAEHFQGAGWVTYAAVSAGGLLDDRSGLGQGFDRMLGPTDGFADSAVTIDQLLAWMDDAEGLPLFVWLHLFDAHTPYREHPSLVHYYPSDRDPRDPALREPEPWKLQHAPSGIRDLDYVVGLYRAEISHLDEQLERVFEHGRLRHAITAFTSDHGESLSEHDIYFGHQELYPQTLSIPLILAWPDGPRGERVARPVQQLDLGRTLLHLAGVEAGTFPGALLSSQEAPSAPRFALSAGGRSASVFAGDWFLVLHLAAHSHPNPERPRIERHSLELYDRSLDPGCFEDLAQQRPDEARRLRALLVEWLLSAQSTGWNLTHDAGNLDALEELVALGYTMDSRDSSENEWFDAECACALCRAFE